MEFFHHHLSFILNAKIEINEPHLMCFFKLTHWDYIYSSTVLVYTGKCKIKHVTFLFPNNSKTWLLRCSKQQKKNIFNLQILMGIYDESFSSLHTGQILNNMLSQKLCPSFKICQWNLKQTNTHSVMCECDSQQLSAT